MRGVRLVGGSLTQRGKRENRMKVTVLSSPVLAACGWGSFRRASRVGVVEDRRNCKEGECNYLFIQFTICRAFPWTDSTRICLSRMCLSLLLFFVDGSQRWWWWSTLCKREANYRSWQVFVGSCARGLNIADLRVPT